jgi:hypothetical protein
MKKLVALLLAWFSAGIGLSFILGHFYSTHWLTLWTRDSVSMGIGSGLAFIALASSIAMFLSCRKHHKKHTHHRT